MSRASMGPADRRARRFTVLVLAGRRGSGDPLAEAAGAPHRALLDVAGTPMLQRVLETLGHSERVASIFLSIDAPELLEEIPTIAAMLREGLVRLVPPADSPSRSVLAAIDAIKTIGDEAPLLVTTADHALLDEAMLSHFLGEAEESDADLAIALVPASVIQARFPEAKRTYLPFRGERYSGANLFALLTPDAVRAVEFWQKAEHFRKQPWRMVSAFGPLTLLLFLARRLDLRAAFRRASRVIGVRLHAVTMPMAEAAVDVDKLSDLELVNRILAGRA
ncbi:MAG: nucleotidyltransferase family protein [Deltaproteobacteria bacterium]|nr:nucleotidyltransferase family protein [Deltaproteobacteria bacterium]